MNVLADTNALLAFLLDDRPTERRIVAQWVEDNGPLMVTEAVFVETCWVLSGGLTVSRSEVVSHVRRILASSSFDTWDDALVALTLDLMERHAQLAPVDCLLVARAIHGDTVITFDRRLQHTLENL